jgi:putative transposase
MAIELLLQSKKGEVWLFSKSSTAVEAVRKVCASGQTYYRWRREYGGMRIEQAKRLKEFERECETQEAYCPSLLG